MMIGLYMNAFPFVSFVYLNAYLCIVGLLFASKSVQKGSHVFKPELKTPEPKTPVNSNEMTYRRVLEGKKIQLLCDNSATSALSNWYRTTFDDAASCKNDLHKLDKYIFVCEVISSNRIIQSNFTKRFSTPPSDGKNRNDLIIDAVELTDAGIYTCHFEKTWVFKQINLTIESVKVSSSTQGSTVSLPTTGFPPTSESEDKPTYASGRSTASESGLVILAGVIVIVVVCIISLTVFILLKLRNSKSGSAVQNETDFEGGPVPDMTNRDNANNVYLIKEDTKDAGDTRDLLVECPPGYATVVDSIEGQTPADDSKTATNNIYMEINPNGFNTYASPVNALQPGELNPNATSENPVYEEIRRTESEKNTEQEADNGADLSASVKSLKIVGADGTEYVLMKKFSENDASSALVCPTSKDPLFQKSIYTMIDHTATAPPAPPPLSPPHGVF